MKIGELAKAGGVLVQTVRYYERYGLLRPPIRTAAQYRIYGDKDLQRLRFILHAKTLGFTLNEIKQVIRLSERQVCPCGEVFKFAEERLSNLQWQIKQLTKFRDHLADAVKRWKKSPGEPPKGDAICVLIEQTMVNPNGSAEKRNEQSR
jgi:DNA-binding transcriptional MerR regulator